MDRAKDLMKELDVIDAKLQQHEAVLKENNIGMDEPLVDAEGFPRSDVNVHAVRNARHEIICLRNDRMKKFAEVEQAIVEAHSNGQQAMEVDEQQQEIVHRTSNDPFVQVDTVSTESPAHQAGMSKGDLIIQFGSLHADIFERLDQLKDIVEKNVNKPIRITALRQNRVQKLQLVPRVWSGAGLVGCAFTVLDRKKK